MKLCKHDDYHLITHIKDPKWSTDEILISDSHAIKEHLVIRFANKSPKEKYGWFYMSGSKVRKHPTQRNGRAIVYVVPMSKREELTINKECQHQLMFDD